MARAAVPVINALTDDGHPVQVLCDVFTLEEQLGSSARGKRVAFVGDCGSNMARSWLEAAPLFGFDLALAGPSTYSPPAAELAAAGASVKRIFDPTDAVTDCAVVNTDVWTSMGREGATAKPAPPFRGWIVTEKMLRRAKPEAIVLHCLPAHGGGEIGGEGLDAPRSRGGEDAEHRRARPKALRLCLLGMARGRRRR